MREVHLEHPTIVQTLRTGYPAPVAQPHCCPGCEAEINPRDDIYELDGELYCRECFGDWVRDYLSSNPQEIAEMLNVKCSCFSAV